MPGPVHSQKTEIVYRLERPSLRAVDCVGRQRFGCESGAAGIGDRVGGGETAEPVADPIRIASPYDNADAALDDGGEGGEEVAGV